MITCSKDLAVEVDEDFAHIVVNSWKNLSSKIFSQACASL